MHRVARSFVRNSFSIGLFGGLMIGIPLMVLGFGALGTAVLMVGIFGGLLAESLQSDAEEDPHSSRVPENEGSEQDELDELRERYVEGDLSEAEFERRVQQHLEAEEAASESATRNRSRGSELEREP